MALVGYQLRIGYEPIKLPVSEEKFTEVIGAHNRRMENIYIEFPSLRDMWVPDEAPSVNLENMTEEGRRMYEIERRFDERVAEILVEES